MPAGTPAGIFFCPGTMRVPHPRDVLVFVARVGIHKPQPANRWRVPQSLL